MISHTDAPTPTLEFRPLRDEEAEAGYELLCETVSWLRQKEIELWEKPLPRAVYFARQGRGENFGLFGGESLIGICSLTSIPAYWSDWFPGAGSCWISTLTTRRAQAGRGLGAHIVQAASHWLQGQGETRLLLDCAPGFLEKFYTALGFETLERRFFTLAHRSPQPLEVLLMQKKLDGA